MRQPKYCIYPSLLDSFQNYLDSDANYERFFGHSEEPSMTAEEYEKKQFDSLIDRINRVPFVSEAADKGSCLNEIVDCILLRKKSTRDDITICSKDGWVRSTANGIVSPFDGKVVGGDVDEDFISMPHIEAVKGDFTFRFDIAFCRSLAEYFKDAIPQLYTEAFLETSYGLVKLYGFIDYLRRDKVFDLKSTSDYKDFGKYSKGWQQYVYPWTLIESGECSEIKSFEYSAVKLVGGTSKTPLISGTFYPEVYMYDHRRSTVLLVNICERFIEFLENNRSLITDTKVFGDEKERKYA